VRVANNDEANQGECSNGGDRCSMRGEEGAKYARFNFFVGYLVAQKTERPTWNKGDFFGEHRGTE
jgi:hypothetical protein